MNRLFNLNAFKNQEQLNHSLGSNQLDKYIRITATFLKIYYQKKEISK
jgi:hypothetical protein